MACEVAMLVPIVQAWAERHAQPVQALLMPLAFASTLGGTLTMIGSAANLLAQDCARSLQPPVELEFLSLTPYALPLNFLGLSFMWRDPSFFSIRSRSYTTILYIWS